MGIAGIISGIHLSKCAAQHLLYPYLLRGVTVTAPGPGSAWMDAGGHPAIISSLTMGELAWETSQGS